MPKNELESEKQLRIERDNFKTYIDLAGVIMVAINPSGNVTLINKAGCDVLGYKREYIIGKNWFDNFLPKKGIERVKSIFNKVIAGDIQGVEYAENAVVTKNGEEKLIAWCNTFLKDDKGNITLSLSSGEDITDKKKAEEILKNSNIWFEKELALRSRELERAYKSLEMSKRLSDIGMLAATIAHELRNPLGVIRTAAYNIKNKTNDSSCQSHLNNIEKKILESDQIIKNLLSYSRLKEPIYEKVSVIKTFNECIQNLNEKYFGWNVAVKIKSCCTENDFMDADLFQITELFMNVIDNAYQSLVDKCGKIEIDVHCEKNENRLEIKIKDSGTGISKEDLPKVFEPFFTKKARGIGLGLSVCSQITRIHGGVISMESEPGKGTTVNIVLPIRRVEPGVKK